MSRVNCEIPTDGLGSEQAIFPIDVLRSFFFPFDLLVCVGDCPDTAHTTRDAGLPLATLSSLISVAPALVHRHARSIFC
jgi:hypothetical protein